MSTSPPRVLFICTGNAGRSQLAHAHFTAMAGDEVEVLSAGVDPWDDLHPVARKMMDADGFDTSVLHPEHVNAYADTPLDWVITLGDRAQAETPRLTGNPVRMHWEIADPADADGTGREEEVFAHTLAFIARRLPELLESVRRGPCLRQLHLAPGISTCIFRPDRFDPAKHLPMIAEAGFACIELVCYLGSDDFAWDRPAVVAELIRVADDTGVRVASVHAEGGVEAYRGARPARFAIDMHKAQADLAAELGAGLVVMHADRDAGLEEPEATAQLRATLEELSDHILDMPCLWGWENIALTPAEHLAWLRDLDPAAFGFVFDSGHAHMVNTIDVYLDDAGLLLRGLHLHDNDGGRDLHQIPGAGTFPWQGFVEKIEGTGALLPLIVEALVCDRQDDLPAVLAEARSAVSMIRGEA